jgi:hypothetical protein
MRKEMWTGQCKLRQATQLELADMGQMPLRGVIIQRKIGGGRHLGSCRASGH